MHSTDRIFWLETIPVNQLRQETPSLSRWILGIRAILPSFGFILYAVRDYPLWSPLYLISFKRYAGCHVADSSILDDGIVVYGLIEGT